MAHQSEPSHLRVLRLFAGWFEATAARGRGTAHALAIVVVTCSLTPAGLAAQGLPGVLTEHTRMSNPDTNTLGFGRTLAVDGDTMVVGAPQIGGTGVWRGAVYVYTRTSGGWVLQQSITRSDRWAFGDRVALSGDTLVATTEYVSGEPLWRPLVFVRTNGVWAVQGELAHGDPWAGSEDVVLAGDAAVVSTRGGGVFAFTRNAGVWTPQVVRPVGSAASRVAIDGASMLLGTPSEAVGASANQGAVHVYSLRGSVWTEVALLTASDGRTDARFGAGVALQGDSAFIMGGDKVYAFRREAGQWAEQSLLDPPRLPSSLGNAHPYRAYLHGDVGVVTYATSAPYSVSYVHRRLGGRWTKLAPVHPAASTYTPADIAVRDDGIFVGFSQWGNTGPYPSSLTAYPGKVFIYGLPAGALPLAPSLTGYTSGPTRTTVNLSWTPGAGDPPASYQLEYFTEDAPTVRALDVGATQQVSAPVPSGFYHLRVRGVNAFGLGDLSNEVMLSAGYFSAPGPPTNLVARVEGSTVHFTWIPPSVGTVQNYLLSARQSPGGPVVASMTLGPAPALSVPGVPPGNYYVSVQASESSVVGTLVGGASNQVSFTVAPPSLPGPPTLQAPAVQGTTVTLSWSAGTGSSPSGYTLTASATPGGLPIVTLPLTGTSASFAGVPSGTYFLRLTATNGAGTSAPSNEVSLTVTGAVAPAAPTLNAPTVSGNTVPLSWRAGAGAASTSYSLMASAASNGPPIATVPLTSTTASFSNVPNGTYYVRVTASNAAGTSAPGNEASTSVGPVTGSTLLPLLNEWRHVSAWLLQHPHHEPVHVPDLRHAALDSVRLLGQSGGLCRHADHRGYVVASAHGDRRYLHGAGSSCHSGPRPQHPARPRCDPGAAEHLAVRQELHRDRDGEWPAVLLDVRGRGALTHYGRPEIRPSPAAVRFASSRCFSLRLMTSDARDSSARSSRVTEER